MHVYDVANQTKFLNRKNIYLKILQMNVINKHFMRINLIVVK